MARCKSFAQKLAHKAFKYPRRDHRRYTPLNFHDYLTLYNPDLPNIKFEVITNIEGQRGIKGHTQLLRKLGVDICMLGSQSAASTFEYVPENNIYRCIVDFDQDHIKVLLEQVMASTLQSYAVDPVTFAFFN